MKMKYYGLMAAASAVVIFSGCANTGVIPLDNGVYYISEQEYAAMGPPGAEIINKVYDGANRFCENQGKVVKVVKRDVGEMQFGKNASFSLEFKCVKK